MDDEDPRYSFGRMKLKEPFNMRNLLEGDGADFELDESSSRICFDEGADLWGDGDFGSDDENAGLNERHDVPEQQESEPDEPNSPVLKSRLTLFADIRRRKDAEKVRREQEKKKEKISPMLRDSACDGMEPITEDGQLLKIIRHVGNGSKPPPGSTCKVWIHYTVYRESDVEQKEPIDDSYSRPLGKTNSKVHFTSRQFTFTLFQHDVLPALEYGVASMEVHEQAQFLATYNYAYGPLGIPNICAPKTNCIFNVELLKFVDVSLAKTITEISSEEQAQLSFEHVIEAAKQLKETGNLKHKQEDWEQALKIYRKGVSILDRHSTALLDEDQERNDLLFVFYNNMAQTCLGMDEPKRALAYCEKAEQLPPGTKGNRAKLAFRQCSAYLKLDKLEMARDACKKSINLEPGNSNLEECYANICRKLGTSNVGTDGNGIYEKIAKAYFAP